MAGAENERGAVAKTKSKYRKYRRYIVESRQEISACLKYILFAVNFIFWMCGIACTILGIYLYAKDFRAIFEAIDFFLNPSILLIICGCLIFVIAFFGCTGALRENVCLLKLFSLCLFFAYICLVILAFVVFMLFYSDTKTGLSIQSLLQSGVKKYHENDNMRELMDYLQSNLGCCGATSQGYKDWNMNALYNCSPSNPTPEQCGVPPSCCKVGPAVSPSVTVGPKNNPAPLQRISASQQAAILPSEQDLPAVSSSPNVVTNPRCGFHTQDKSITDLQNILYTDGCIQPLQRVFESNAVVIGAVIGAVIIPVCLSVTFANVLAKQIEHQRYLLEKEARKEERRRRRNRTKFRDPFAGVTLRGSRNVATGVERRAASVDTAALQALSPSADAVTEKDPCTKLIIERDQQEPPGPSRARKYFRGRSKSEDKPQQAPLRKRSGNPDLPPIPTAEPPSHNLDQKRQRREADSQNKPRPVTSGAAEPNKEIRPPQPQRRGPRVEPRVVEEHRRRVQKPERDRARRRSRSKEADHEPYKGPIIVEIESITHDGPAAPSASAESSEAVLTGDDSSKALLENGNGETAIADQSEPTEPQNVSSSRKNSKEQTIPAIAKNDGTAGVPE